MEDVVVIGAGLSGITAASQLHQAGYRVLVVDKSRGLGGRMATRRHGSTAIDHGCRYWQPLADGALSPIPRLLKLDVLHRWQPETFNLEADGSLSPTTTKTLYVAPQGMSAAAKALASELTIHRQWRAVTLTPSSEGWRIEGECAGLNDQAESRTTCLEARAVVIAIPAPQAIALIDAAAQYHHGLSTLVEQLQQVTFEAVITTMAGYASNQPTKLTVQRKTNGWMVNGYGTSALRWVALDSSKRSNSPEPVVVAHSSAAFAAANIDRADLSQAGRELLANAAKNLGAWLNDPAWMQVHRWRYGFVLNSLGITALSLPTLPHLVGCGDWCNGGNAEGAIASGHQAAKLITAALQ